MAESHITDESGHSLITETQERMLVFDFYITCTVGMILSIIILSSFININKRLKIDDKKYINKIYHVSDREKTTWYDIANFIKKKISRKKKIKCILKKINSSKFKTLAKRPLFSYLD